MRKMPAGQFKTHCLTVMDEILATREPVVVTKRGKPVVKVMPLSTTISDNVFDCLRGEMEILGDVESTAIPPDDWDVAR